MLQQHTRFPFPHPFISPCQLQPCFPHLCCSHLTSNSTVSGFNNLKYLPLFCRLPIYLFKQTRCMTSPSGLVLLRAGNSAAVLFSLPLPARRGRRIRFGRPETDRTADKTDRAIYTLLCTVTLCYLLQRIHSLLHCENAKELRYVRGKSMLPYHQIPTEIRTWKSFPLDLWRAIFNTVICATGSCWKVQPTFPELSLRLQSHHLYFVSEWIMNEKKSCAFETDCCNAVHPRHLVLSHLMQKLCRFYKTEVLWLCSPQPITSPCSKPG
jgi:hypothetical protein